MTTLTTRMLGSFLPADGVTEAVPVVSLTGPAAEAVVLAWHDAYSLEVFTDESGITVLPEGTEATEITEPSRKVGLVIRAFLAVDEARRQSEQQHARERQLHGATLTEIRRYAIEKHHEDFYCLDGLNAFLRAFGLPEYDPRLRVSFTISGSYEVDSTDESSTRYDAEQYLTARLTEISDLVDGSEDIGVQVNDVEPVSA